MHMLSELLTASDLSWWLAVGACPKHAAGHNSRTKILPKFQRPEFSTKICSDKIVTILSLLTRVPSSLSRATWLNTPPRRGGLLVRQWLYTHSGASHHATVSARDYKFIYIVAHITMPPLQPMQNPSRVF